MALDREAEGQIGNQEAARRVTVTSRHDPSTYNGFCCGDYTKCVIWRAEKHRLDLAKQGIRAPLGTDPAEDTYGNAFTPR